VFLSALALANWWTPFGWDGWGNRLILPFAMTALIIAACATETVLSNHEKPQMETNRILWYVKFYPMKKNIVKIFLIVVFVIVIIVSLAYVTIGYSSKRLEILQSSLCCSDACKTAKAKYNDDIKNKIHQQCYSDRFKLFPGSLHDIIQPIALLDSNTPMFGMLKCFLVDCRVNNGANIIGRSYSGIEFSGTLPPPIRVGESLSFSAEAGTAYLLSGWSCPESWGIWTEGSNAKLVLPLPKENVSLVLIEAMPLVNPDHPEQAVKVLVNGIESGKFRLTTKGQFDVQIPEASKRNAHGIFIIEFQLPDAVRPSDIGINDDSRKLALGLISITLQ
jgi:hypothetical protein